MGLNLAPIVLFCYNRPWHLRQTIASLQLNTLAAHSDLIIYSDGPKRQSDEALIQEIRAYISSIDGFKSVKTILAESNNGLANSVITGVTKTVCINGTVIVLEDDMLTTPDFLSFMNEALNAYQSRSDIFSVTAYSPPFDVPASYTEDLFLAPRASSWGWATWEDRWEKADWKVSDFESLKKDTKKREQLLAGGDDLWPMLVKQQQGIIDSWAIRWTYSQFRNNAFGIYPVRSKLKNIGTDGSGTNFTFSSGSYGKEMNMEKIVINPELKPNPEVIKAFGNYYHLPLYLKIKNWIKYQIR